MENSFARSSDGQNYTTQYRVVWPDGGIHWIGQRGAVLKNKNGKPSNLLGVVYSIDQPKIDASPQKKPVKRAPVKKRS